MKITILRIILTIFIILSIFLLNAWLPFSTFFGDVLYRGDSESNKIALTFDDGPGEQTKEILNILKENNVTATFFVIGNNINLRQGIIEEINNDNHEIGVHTMTHPFLLKNNKYELTENKLQIENLTNKTVKYFRPPYGFRTLTTMSVAKKLDLTTVLWNVFPRDYSSTSDQIIKRVLRNTKSGSIICLHDGPVNRNETVKALPVIISELRNKDFEFVSLDELNK